MARKALPRIIAHNNVTGSNSAAVKTANGDVYAGHNGNVYQHDSSGWSQYNNGSFQQVTPPATSKPATAPGTASSQPRPSSTDFNQLNHDMTARQGGAQQQYGYRQSGGFGGGGFGGGGRRH